MRLSDNDIFLAKQEKKIKIKPFRKGNLRPSSYELHLGNSAMFFDVNSQMESVIDLLLPVDEFMDVEKITKEYGAFLPPGGFVMVASEETIELDNSHVANVSSIGSVDSAGLSVKSVNGAVEPGMKSKVILYIRNVSPCSIMLYPGMPIAQVTFDELKSPSGLSGKGKGKDIPSASDLHKRIKK